MRTDLRAALCEAAASAPDDPYDPRELLDLGAQRLRRRNARAATVVASALAAAAVVIALLVLPGPGRRESEPLPAEVVHLDLDAAAPLDLDVLVSRRTLATAEDDLSYDRFEGLTSDGLVLRARYTLADDNYRIGLVDPENGRTDWLPRPPLEVGELLAGALTADRLVLFDRQRSAVLIYDRGTRTWARSRIRVPAGIEVHVPPELRLGPDGRLYLGANMENDFPMHWWSYPLPGGGEARPEADLEGMAVAWTSDGRVTADVRGRVVETVGGVDRILSDHRPASCPVPKTPFRPLLELAGDRPVLTYWCGQKRVPQNVTVVLGEDAGPSVEVVGIALAANDDQVLLAGGPDGPDGTYLLDLETLAVRRIGPSLNDPQAALADGLVLWNNAGPSADPKRYDVVWKVARLP